MVYNVSTAFKNLIYQPSRSIRAKIEINGNVYDEEYISELNYEDLSNPSNQFELGATASATINLSLINVNEVFEVSSIKPYIGLDIGGTIEYVPLGVFYADDIQRKKNVVSLTLYDGMIKLEQAYFSNLTYPASITQVINEICAKTGFQFAGTLPNYQIKEKPEGYTYREVVGYIAQMCGGFAKFDRDGELTIKSYTATQEIIGGDNYIDYEKRKDRVYRIDRITVQVGEEILSKGTLSAGGSKISFENPFFNKSILTDVYNKLDGFYFLPTWLKMQGNPALECGDIITLTTVDNEIINIPIMSVKLNFAGGLIGEIESFGESENKNQFNSTGSTSKKVERVVYEQALINQALINKADIDELRAVDARIDDLYAHDITAINADVENLFADVAAIDELLAGNLTAENFKAGAITAGSGIIAEGAIGDAEIGNLSANKITSGTIDTSRVRVSGPQGQLQIFGNSLQIFDIQVNGQLLERIFLGVDEAGNSSLVLRGADGQTVLLNQDGLTEAGFTDGYNKLPDGSLDPVKINISKVVESINEGETRIDGSIIEIDNSSLTVLFNHLRQIVLGAEERLTTVETEITALAGEIELKASKTEVYTKEEMDESLGDIDERITSTETRVEDVEGSIEVLAGQVNLKANKTEVYTKTEVDEAIDAVEVGGRNLVRNSAVLDNKFSVAGGFQGTRTIVDDPEALCGKRIEVECTTSGSGPHFPVFPKTPDKIGKKFVWSFWAKASTNKTGNVGHECGGQKQITLTTTWQRFVHTWTFTDTQFHSFVFYLNWNVGEKLYIRDFMIEEGTKASYSWTPAPEDVQEQIDNKPDTTYVDDRINSVVTDYQSMIEMNADEILAQVSETITTTEGVLREYTDSKVAQTAEDFNISFTNMQQSVDEQGQSINEVRQYFNFSEDGFDIGRTDSPLNINISNEQLSFKDNGNIVAYINGQKMFITDAEILKSLVVGNHKIEKYNNEITILRWVGV